MVRAAVFGVIASSALIIGAVLGVWIRLPQRLLAMLLAFAAGSLITALAFELFEDSYEQGGAIAAGVGFAAGAVVFTVISAWLDRRVERAVDQAGSAKVDTNAASTERTVSASATGSAAGLALLAAVTLDGVPENLALGVSLGEAGTGGLVLLVAIFLSNLPESLVGAASMREQGRSTAFVIGTWAIAAVLLAGAVVLGRGLLAGAEGAAISVPLAFAAGAVVASLADTLMPEAYEKGGSAAALATAAGFLLSFLLSTL
ncbi:MAG TPA: ZIP family zinc transporter [Micromonosporaceae bacterium]|nr:ZIP family zinc transporter [Micromonosporaceae bacterium]